MSKFKYVLSIKISVRQTGKAEYHMFFATQHEDGAILMGDSMGKREDQMQEIREGGQLSLFSLDSEKDSPYDVIDHVLENYKKTKTPRIRLKVFKAISYTYMSKYITESDFNKYLKSLEKVGRINVERYPAITPKTRQKSSFWSDDHGRALWIIP